MLLEMMLFLRNFDPVIVHLCRNITYSHHVSALRTGLASVLYPSQ